jgi:hypothetical protein
MHIFYEVFSDFLNVRLIQEQIVNQLFEIRLSVVQYNYFLLLSFE